MAEPRRASSRLSTYPERVPDLPLRVHSDTGATLRWTHRPAAPRAAVLLLHGGQAHGSSPTSWRQLSMARVYPFAGAIARRGGGGIAVAFLRYAVRGWNDAAPVRDARWALTQIRGELPGMPIGVAGYSMGGRTALRLCGDPGVASLVTLAAWADARDVAMWQPRRGLPVLMMHGSADRVTDPRGTELAARTLRSGGAEVDVVAVEGDTHAMLRQARTWHGRTAEHLAATLLTAPTPR